MLDPKGKRQRLEEMKNEVDDLHSLLTVLLGELPHINRSEYTHGPNEKGADFVLEKIDPTLGTVIYIGVIAKLGKIHQDLSDVERQIDECKMPRLILNGEKRISISEIWVITNSSITANAKEKIQHKFTSTSIRFIDYEMLIRLVDQYVPYYWHNLPNAIGTYLQHIWKTNEELDRQASLLGPAKDRFYIDLDVVEIPRETYKRQFNRAPQLVNINNEINDHQVLIVEGEMGYGKSKLLRHMVDVTATPQSYLDTRVLPISVTYKTFLEKFSGDVIECIKRNLAEAWNLTKFDETRFLVLIDGVDEVTDANVDHISTINSIVDQVSAYENIKIVITTRPTRMLEEATTLSKNIRRYGLRPLSLAKIIKFIDKICASVNLPKRLIEDLKKSDLFQQLPQSPIAAILLSNLLMESQKELPSNLTDLYAKSLELMLGRWDIDKGLFTLKEYEACDRLCGHLAQFVMDNGLDQVSMQEARQMFDQYLGARNLGVTAEGIFERTVTRSGLLGCDPRNGTLFFKHRSFAEFLYAKHAFGNGAIKIDSRIFEPFWAHVFFFRVGLQKDCLPLVEEMLRMPTNSETERWRKVVYSPSYLLAAFASPYRLVEENLYKLFIEAGQLYKEVKSGQTTTKLRDFSEMQVLYIIQYMLRQTYGYEFFRKSVEATIVRIEDELVDTEVKTAALFFLGAVALEFDESAPMKFLVEEYGAEKLPLALNFAVECELESKADGQHSPLYKKHHKKLRKLLPRDAKKIHHVNELLEKLFKMPLKLQNQRPEKSRESGGS